MRIAFFILGMLVCLQLSAQEAHYATKRNLTYTTSTDAYAQARCKVDVYYPTDAKDCPVVVWFHGGGLNAGQKAIPGRCGGGRGLDIQGDCQVWRQHAENLPVGTLGRRLPHHHAGAGQEVA